MPIREIDRMGIDRMEAEEPFDPQFLDILACPDTKQAVHLMQRADLEALNSRIQKGQVRSKAGQSVMEPLHGALVREDGRRAYPIRDGIPIMLIEEAIYL